MAISGTDPGREIIKKTRPAYNSLTEKRIVLRFVAIEPEGKDGHFNVYSSLQTVCFKRTKKLVFFLVPRPILLRRRRCRRLILLG